MFWSCILILRRKRAIFSKENIHCTKKMMLSIKDFFSKYYQLRKKLQIWSHLLRKSWMEIVIFCAVTYHCVKKCPYSDLFWSAFSRIWTKYGVILCIIVHIAHSSIFLRKLKHYSSTSALKKNILFLKQDNYFLLILLLLLKHVKARKRNTRKEWERCSKLIIKTPERLHQHCSRVLIAKF